MLDCPMYTKVPLPLPGISFRLEIVSAGRIMSIRCSGNMNWISRRDYHNGTSRVDTA